MYSKGSVDAILTEICHKDKEIQLSANLDADAGIEQIVNDIGVLIDCFIEGNWHVFMDFMTHNKEWRHAVEEYNKHMLENEDDLIEIIYYCV